MGGRNHLYGNYFSTMERCRNCQHIKTFELAMLGAVAHGGATWYDIQRRGDGVCNDISGTIIGRKYACKLPKGHPGEHMWCAGAIGYIPAGTVDDTCDCGLVTGAKMPIKWKDEP